MEASSSISNSDVKKNLKLLGLFLLFLVVGNAVATGFLEYAYARTLAGSSGGRLNYFLQNHQKYKAVILGNSRAHRQIDPEQLFLPTYNLAHSGMDSVFHVGLLSELARQNALPSVVLLHLDTRFFVTGRNRKSALGDAGHLKQLYGKNPDITRFIREQDRFADLKYLLTAYRFNGKVLPILKNAFASAAEQGNGYQALEPSPEDMERVKEAFGRKGEVEPGKGLSEAECELLRLAVKICKDNNVKLVCFTGPVLFPDYDLTQAKAFLDKELGAEGVPYFDFQRDAVSELDETMWRDQTHLNHKGALILSKELSRRLQAVLPKSGL